MNKNHKIENADFTSDSDYSYNSDIRKSKKKKAKKSYTKKDKKSRKIKNIQKSESADKKSEISVHKCNAEIKIKKETVVPSITDCKIEKVVTVLPTNANNGNFMSKKRDVEEDSIVKEHLKKNEDVSKSLVLNNMLKNDGLLSTNNDNIYKTTNLKLLRPLPTIKLNNKPSSTNGSLQFNSYINTLPHTRPSSVNSLIKPIVPLLCYESGQNYMQVEQPTLEPIRIKMNRDDKFYEGMLMFIINFLNISP